jgi:Mn-containing catalase
MFLHVQRLINEIVPDEPDPAAANALQEGLGGQFGEMRTMMQYLFQAMNFRGPNAKPYRDLLHGIGTEEISHVELIGTTIARLTDGSPRYNGKATKPVDEPGKALETLGVNWGAALPIPKTDAERFPEVKKLLDQGLQNKQYTFSLDNLSEAGKIYQGAAAATAGGGTLTTEQMPEGFPMDIAVERPEEFAPGLDAELLKLVQATAEIELKDADQPQVSQS